jgi:RNA polymerase sigma-70 factor (ECF subfamily)
MALADFRRALSKLPIEQREAIVLVGAEGFTYDEAAKICGCASGTVKSRVSRARKSLSALLHFEPEDLISNGTTVMPPPVSSRLRP